MKKHKKLIDVFVREVIDLETKTIFDEKLNAYITYKHVNKTSNTCYIYINGKKMPLVSDGYTMLEYSSLDDFYNVRVFLDDKGHIITYYFDVVSKFDIVDGEVYYDDLFLDVLYDVPERTGASDYITLLDQKDLIDAFNDGSITREEVDFAYSIAHKIMDELINKTNKFVNRKTKDYKRFIKE